jgi:hypothetical protein
MHVSTLYRALKLTPKALDCVCMDIATNILFLTVVDLIVVVNTLYILITTQSSVITVASRSTLSVTS